MVAMDQDPLLLDGRRQVPVADMPCQLGQMASVARPDGVERFLGGDHLGVASVGQHQHVAMLERHGHLEFHQQPLALRELEHAPPQMPFVAFQDDPVEGRWPLRIGVQLGGAADGGGSEHCRHSF